MKYCSNCGNPVRLGVPPGDHRERYICDRCHTVHYQNPRLVVGCIPRWEEKVLLCKRSIEPRLGLWTLPAGFLENGESAEQGALRETIEEARANLEIVRLFSLYSIPHIGQIYLFFLANLKNLDFHPGLETEQVNLFAESEIPWKEIAFPSVRFTIESFFKDLRLPGEIIYTGSYGRKREDTWN